jgi:hypothetical protein
MNEPDRDALGLPEEKKRNRLGYARTNIACGTWPPPGYLLT